MGSLASNTLKMGDPAPDFILPDLDGRPFELRDVLQGGTVLLLFTPGAWSTNARRQILELDALLPRLDALGIIPLMVITQNGKEARRTLQAFLSGPDRSLSQPSLSFPVLVDGERRVARDYGIFRAVSLSGLRVCRPAIFLVDPAGELVFVYVGEGDADIPDMPSLLQLLGAAASPRLVPIVPLFGRGQRLIQGWDLQALPRLARRAGPAAKAESEPTTPLLGSGPVGSGAEEGRLAPAGRAGPAAKGGTEHGLLLDAPGPERAGPAGEAETDAPILLPGSSLEGSDPDIDTNGSGSGKP